MCGIAGIFDIHGRPVAPQEVEAMCKALKSRGPDDDGFYVHGSIGLGMRRLSIIDLKSGKQPVHNEDGMVQVVLNGEIYNYREQRRHLESMGHRFYTASDTEVIVHLYEEYGEEFVHLLRGMFAFALWDARLEKLLVVRDRLGIKPLFYGEFDGKLVFASELKAVLQLPWVDRELNWGSVAHLFSFLTTPRDESIVAGIHKLQPGHMLSIVANQAPKVSEYWDVRFQADHHRDEKDFIEELRERLAESVRMHRICDVPVGAFLSGGIDSSAVVATMARQSKDPVKTFTIGFPEKGFNEITHAWQVAKAFGTEHHELILESDVMGIIDDLTWALDEPFGDSSAIPTYMVSKLAAEHVKVVLSGDGGDELFAGYDKYCVEQRERRYRHVPAQLRSLLGAIGGRMAEGRKGRNFLRHIALNGAHRYLDAGTMFDRQAQRSLFLPQAAERIMTEDPWREMINCMGKESGHWLSAVQYLDIKNYLPLDILTKVDRMSMAHSIEARVPLLDHKLVEFAATIPPELRLRNGSTKHIFKRAMRGILPDSIIDRPKQGFAIPLQHWFRDDLHGFVQELLLSPSSRARKIFDPEYIENLLLLQSRGRPLELQLWTLISFEMWCRTFLDRAPVRSEVRPMQVRQRAEVLHPHGEMVAQ